MYGYKKLNGEKIWVQRVTREGLEQGNKKWGKQDLPEQEVRRIEQQVFE